MSEQATVISLNEWTLNHSMPTVQVSDSALNTALGHIRMHKQVAHCADELEIAAQWSDEENSILNALGGLGLKRYPQTYE